MDLPYFKFMVQDYLSGDICACSLKSQGVFINLCARSWKSNGCYSKPIAVLSRHLSVAIDELKSCLDELFDMDCIYYDDSGYIRIKFIDEQMSELSESHEQKVLAGRLGAKKRWGKQTHSTAIAPPKQSDTESDTESDNTPKPPKKKKGYDDKFELFWKSYPKKIGKGAAYKAWLKVKPNIDICLKALEWQKKSDQWLKDSGQYIPNPSTWLNQCRWDDEAPSKHIRVKASKSDTQDEWTRSYKIGFDQLKMAYKNEIQNKIEGAVSDCIRGLNDKYKTQTGLVTAILCEARTLGWPDGEGLK